MLFEYVSITYFKCSESFLFFKVSIAFFENEEEIDKKNLFFYLLILLVFIFFTSLINDLLSGVFKVFQ